jgi:hypothetical protein
MDIAVTLRTEISFEDLEDINDARDIIVDEMTPEEILELAQRQGNPVNIDVEEY